MPGPCAGHPRTSQMLKQNVDGRDKPGHDGLFIPFDANDA